MKVKPTILLSFALFLSLTGLVRGQYVYNLPQVAGGSGIRTTFVFFNNSNIPATITLSLFDDAGAPMAISLPGLGSSGVYNLSLQAGQTRFYQSSASGALAVGSGRVVSSAPIGVSAIFTLYSGQSILTETGIGGSEALSRFTIAVDTMEGRNTGLAIQNLSPVASVDTTLTLTLFDAQGTKVGTKTRTLPKFGHFALFVGGADSLFPSATNFRGQLLVSASSQVAASTLLQHVSGAPLTSLPVVPQSSTQMVFNLPQVANGFQAGTEIGVKTTFVLFNPGTEAALVSLDLTEADGKPFPVTLDDGQTGSQFTYRLGARSTRFISTTGHGPVTTGAARVRSSVPLGVSAIFRLLDGQGRTLTETGVGDSPGYTSLTLPVDLTSGFDTGVALFNQNGSAASVRFQLIDRNGTVIGTPSDATQYVVLGQEAKYVTEIFPGVTNIQGQLAVTSTLPLAAVTLRQGAGGSPLTTMPVSRGVTGTQVPAGAKAVQKRLNGIDIDRERQLDVRLDAGHELTGTIDLPTGSTLIPTLARFIGASGEVFPGYLRAPGLGRLRWEYSGYLPSGTYTLQLLLATSQDGQTGTGLPTVAYQMHTQPGIVVSGPTSRGVSVTGTQTFSVTGTLQDLLRLPPTALAAHTVALLFSSSETGAAALASVNSTGQYSARLPDGQFRVDLAVLLADNQTQVRSAAVLGSIGQVTVNNHAVSAANFSVPSLPKIQGQLIQPTLPAIPPEAFVIGVDAGAPPPPFLQIPLLPVTAGFSYGAAGGGLYTLYVKRDTPYDLMASVSLPSTNQDEKRFWTTPLPGSSTESFTADASRDFTFNPPINPYRVTGTVTSAQGTALKNVLVTAVCESLDGAVNTSFHSSTLTGDDGKFELNLVPGTNYTLFFSPYTSTGEGS